MLDVLEEEATLHNRTWTYNKTEDPDALLDPMFWAKFDYVLAEKPEKVIGKWEVVHVVYGFGGTVRLLKAGEESGKLAEPTYATSSKSTDKDDWKTKVAAAWRRLEGVLRYSALGGYWVEIRMDPKIMILENQTKQLK